MGVGLSSAEIADALRHPGITSGTSFALPYGAIRAAHLFPFFDQGSAFDTAVEAKARVLALDHELNNERAKPSEDQERIRQLEAEREQANVEKEKTDRFGFLQRHLSAAMYAGLTDEIVAQFTDDKAHSSFIVSIDIRRSTELMLKTRSPRAFAIFISDLCLEFCNIIQEHYGVVDKFTGDGILAFFPKFISGSNAGANAVAAAAKCHTAFDRLYKLARVAFTAVRTDAGVGIGIDYGQCEFVRIGGAITIVGSPVVYACRFSGGERGTILVNQPAFNVINEHHAAQVRFVETKIDVKHEGELLAYSAQLIDDDYEPVAPEWLTAAKALPAPPAP